MNAPSLHLEYLSADARRQLETFLLDFDQNWTEQRIATAASHFPTGHPLHLPALTELVKIDMERRWKQGRKVLLEGYLKKFPELGTPETVSVELIFAEYRTRRQFGAKADLSDFGQRFPKQLAELQRSIAQAQDSSPRETYHETRATTPQLVSPQGQISTVDFSGGASTGSRGAAPTTLPPQFGRYQTIKRLGQGGMGSVYLVHDSQLQRQVALKVPFFLPHDGPEVLERFHREARAAATLTHANICPIYDVGQIDGIHYVTMGFIEGKPLADLIRGSNGLPQRAAAAIVRKLALAMQEAHAHGVVHRDLKPSNVIINQRKEPIILDFGLARRSNAEEIRLTQTGAILGTPAYMSPEQVRGEVQAMGPGCDIYSLGVILYEMLTGRLPFQGTMTGVLAQIIADPPPPPSSIRKDLEPELEVICLRAMAKRIEDRYASMGDFVAALGQFLKGESRARPTSGKGAPAGTTAKGRKKLVLAAGACVLLAAVGAAAVTVFLSTRPGSDGPRPIAQASLSSEPTHPAPTNPAPANPTSRPEPETPPDPDYTNPNPAAVDKTAPFLCNMGGEYDVTPTGDAAVRVEVKASPALHATFRKMFTSYLRPAGRAIVMEPQPQTILRLMDLDASAGLIEDASASFGPESFALKYREVGFARQQGNRWVRLLTSDPLYTYELLSKEGSRKVTVRGIKKDVSGMVFIATETFLLPPGARKIEMMTKPYQLVYQLPAPAKPADNGTSPVLRLLVKPQLMSVMAKQYGNPRFQGLWVARSVFTNTSGEVLGNLRTRFRVKGYSDWSSWNRCETVYPGQTVVENFYPLLDLAKVREVTSATPTEVEAECEFTRPGGQTVQDAQTAPTKLLGMNDGVYTDVDFTPDMTWSELFKNAPQVLASFATEKDPVVEELVGRIGKKLGARMGGAISANSSDKEARLFMEAIYDMMRCNVTYQSARGNILDGVYHQHLKYPREVLRDKAGTCINTSLLYAACAEAAGLDASIILIPGHAFAAVRLPKSRQLLCVETTLCGGGTAETSQDFAAAVASATATLERALPSGRLNLVTISDWRSRGISPPDLPRLAATVLDDWKIVIPGDLAPVKEAPPVGREAVEKTTATVTILGRERKKVDGRMGLALNVRVNIANAKGKVCVVVAPFFDDKNNLVKSKNKDCTDEDGNLILVELVTPDAKQSEADLTLFLPDGTLPPAPGKRVYTFVVQVLCDGKFLTEDPPSDVVTVVGRP